LKLLLDEMYPFAIAEQLAARGHDVEAVTERSELRALPDNELFAVAQQERRVVVTENIADLLPIGDREDGRGRSHHGLILVNPAKYPRGSRRTIGNMVTALGDLLMAHPTDEPTSLRHWL
jgi:Domain of unknown function (DUF5615)